MLMQILNHVIIAIHKHYIDRIAMENQHNIKVVEKENQSKKDLNPENKEDKTVQQNQNKVKQKVNQRKTMNLAIRSLGKWQSKLLKEQNKLERRKANHP